MTGPGDCRPPLGAATLGRLRHGAYRIILDGDSFRTPKPMPEINQPTSPCEIQQKTAFLSLFEIAFREHSGWPHHADHPRLDCADP